MKQYCPNKKLCGSCSWSHIPYEKQLNQKISDINGSFALKNLDLKVDEIFPSPKTEHYRNRMDFVINYQGLVGLREKGKWWKTIDNHTCFLADERIEHLFHTTRDWVKNCGLSFFDRKTYQGLLRYAVIRSTTTGETMITILTSPAKEKEMGKEKTPQTESQPQANETAEQVQEALQKLAQKAQPSTLIWSINHTISDVSMGDDLRTITGSGFIEENINDLRYRITPNAFFQSNPHAAALLQDTVMEFAQATSKNHGVKNEMLRAMHETGKTKKTVLDLYCGSGFFAIAFGKKGHKTMGVELVSEAIIDAKQNATMNNVKIDFYDTKTENFNWRKFKPGILILDPPRSGLHDRALTDILEYQPPQIIYVSCNHKNFAREMVRLQTKYRVQKMRAIDMFPHTPHVELVTLLEAA